MSDPKDTREWSTPQILRQVVRPDGSIALQTLSTYVERSTRAFGVLVDTKSGQDWRDVPVVHLDEQGNEVQR